MSGLKTFAGITLLLSATLSFAKEYKINRSKLVSHITQHYPEQLTNPQKKNRKSFAQFGYGLYYMPLPVYRVAEFINPLDFGEHSYGEPSKKEHNGSLYTCRGGFMDFSHLRAGVDWSTYITFKALTEEEGFELPSEGASLRINLKNLDKLSVTDIADMSQSIAFERLVWHEIVSWHHHFPNHLTNEQVSTFTPEDVYSNFLGTLIGRNVAVRILTQLETKSYSEIATEEIQKMIDSLDPMAKEEESMQAYDVVDRYKQSQLPESERNLDVWYDSDILMSDSRFIFKRSLNIETAIEPWTVPKLNRCLNSKPEVLPVPQMSKYYDFLITPEDELFFSNRSGKRLHPSFGAFNTKEMTKVIEFIKVEMEEKLLPGFDVRDSKDPVPQFENLKNVPFKH